MQATNACTRQSIAAIPAVFRSLVKVVLSIAIGQCLSQHLAQRYGLSGRLQQEQNDPKKQTARSCCPNRISALHIREDHVCDLLDIVDTFTGVFADVAQRVISMRSTIACPRVEQVAALAVLASIAAGDIPVFPLYVQNHTAFRPSEKVRDDDRNPLS